MRIIAYVLLYIVITLPISIIFNEDSLWICGVICGFVMVTIVAVYEIMNKLDEIKNLLAEKQDYKNDIDSEGHKK